MYHLLAITGAVIPSLLLIWYFYRRDVNPEPKRVLLITFFLGVLTVIPVLLLAIPGAILMHLTVSNGPLRALITAFVLAALIEEFFKFLVVGGYCSRHREFDEPMDGLVYGAIASLGFATLENIMYVSADGLGTALPRALTAVPSHAFLGAIMGYYVARARFGPSTQRGTSWLLALAVPVLLHGLYDFPLMLVDELTDGGNNADQLSVLAVALLAVPFMVLLLEFFIVLQLVRRARDLQLRRKTEQTFDIARRR